MRYLLALSACFIGFSSAARADVVVVEIGANLFANEQSAWEEYISMGEEIANTAQTYVSMLKMLYNCEFYDFLMLFLDEFSEVWGDTDVGQWTADIQQARELYLGAGGSYGQGQQLMRELFGGDGEVLTGAGNTIEFVEATSTRAIKEIGKLREEREKRNLRAEEMLNKANGETGENRLLQTLASENAYLLRGQNDIILELASISEALSVQLQLKREELYFREQYAEWGSEGLKMWFEWEISEEAFPESMP